MAALMKASEAAKAIGMSRSKLYRAAESGRIPHYRLDGAVRFDVDELKNWMRAQALKKEENLAV